MPLERWKGLKYVTLDSPAVAAAKSDYAVPFLPCSSWCPVTSLNSVKMSRTPAPSTSTDFITVGNVKGCVRMLHPGLPLHGTTNTKAK